MKAARDLACVVVVAVCALCARRKLACARRLRETISGRSRLASIARPSAGHR